MNQSHYFETNRLLWNAKTDIHKHSEFYDLQAWKAGKCSLKPPEIDLLGEVSGKSLLHLQCHFGMDTLSWARRGAQVTGVDLSDKSIELARELAAEQGLDAQFVLSNVYDLKENLEGSYDIVFASYGALPWLPDLDRWASVVGHFLKPGGTFCIAEFHPVINMLNWTRWDIEYSYFNTGTPYEETLEGTYADPNADIRQKEYFWNHSLSEVIQALLGSGLTLERIEEYPYSFYDFFDNTHQDSEGRTVVTGKEGMIPMTYALRMRK